MSRVTTVRCPHCNAKLRVKSRRLDGKELTCPRCTQRVLLERVSGTEDYVAVLFFQGYVDRWAATIQPANAEPVSATPDNIVSYRRSERDQRWRWPVTQRATAVAVGFSVLVCILIGGYSVVGNEYRVWKTADGRRSKVKLAYVGHDDRIVRLKRQDNGHEIQVPLTSLSRADRERLQDRNAAPANGGSRPTGSPRVDSAANGERHSASNHPADAGRSPVARNSSTNPVDWPMWRGPSRDGVVSAGPTLLSRWPSGGPQKLWTSERIPGEWEGGWGSVSIADGKAYTFVNIPPNKRQPQAFSGLNIVYCLDANSGETLWKFENEAGRHTTPSNGTPCIADGRVYASGSGGYVYCLDADTGRGLWQAQTSTVGNETSSSFVVSDGVAVVLSGPVTGLDARTGEELWSHNRLRSNHSSVAIWRYEGRSYAICSADRQLAAMDMKSGDIAWQTRLQSANSTPVVSGDRLVVHGRHSLVAYELGDSEPEKLWEVGGGCHGSTPIVYDGFVYSTAAGTARCIRLSDGERMWNEGIGNSNYSSPIIADNKLITVGKSRLLMFSIDTERLDRLAEEQMGLVECTSPTIVDGKLYLRLRQNVVCYDLRA